MYGACGALAVALASGCRSKPKTEPVPPLPSAGQAAAVRPQLSCSESSAADVVLLGSGEAPAALADEEEAIEELPFSVELGTARAGGNRFAIAGLENRRGATFAFVAVVGADGRGQPAELLRVFGDPEPPAVAPLEDGFLLAAASSDAGGPTLRMMRIDPPFTARDVRRGDELSGLRRDVAGFALATSAEQALVAFGKLERGKGRVLLARVDPVRLTVLAPPHELELPDGLEAEAPELVARPGGYYLGFIAHRPHSVRPPAAAAPVASADPADDAPLLAAAPSGLYVVPLDLAGAAVGAPRELSPSGAHVTGFELVRWGESQALAIYRDEPNGPSLDRRSVEAVLVSADGSLARRSWDLGEIAGLPTMLLDPARPKDAPHGWMLVHGETEPRIAPLREDPLATPELVSDPVLRSSEPLAVWGGQLLRARSRGVRAELDLVRCAIVPR